MLPTLSGQIHEVRIVFTMMYGHLVLVFCVSIIGTISSHKT